MAMVAFAHLLVLQQFAPLTARLAEREAPPPSGTLVFVDLTPSTSVAAKPAEPQADADLVVRPARPSDKRARQTAAKDRAHEGFRALAPAAIAISATAQPEAQLSLPPEPAASEPLRLDEQTLRLAAQSARSPLGRMLAEHRVNADPISPTARLAAEVENAFIPDCIGTDALRRMPIRLGGVLDLPLLAYAAATGKCK